MARKLTGSTISRSGSSTSSTASFCCQASMSAFSGCICALQLYLVPGVPACAHGRPNSGGRQRALSGAGQRASVHWQRRRGLNILGHVLFFQNSPWPAAARRPKIDKNSTALTHAGLHRVTHVAPVRLLRRRGCGWPRWERRRHRLARRSGPDGPPNGARQC